MVDSNKSATFGTAEFGYSYFNEMFRKYLIDTILESMESNEISIDTLLSSGLIYKNSYIDTLLLEEKTDKEILTDAIMSQLDIEISQDLDSLLMKTILNNVSIDTLMKSLNITEKQLFDSLLYSTGKEQMIIDSLLSSQVSNDELFDILLEITKSNDSLYDSILSKDKELKNLFDIFVEEKNDINTNLDSLMESRKAISYIFNIYLQSVSAGDKRLLFDSILESFTSLDISFDTILENEGISLSTFFDTFIATFSSNEITIDGLLEGLQISKEDFDALLVSSLSESIDVDTILELVISKESFFDVLTKQLNIPREVIIDSYLYGDKIKVSNYIDSIIEKLGVEEKHLISTVISLVKQNKIDLDTLLEETNLKKNFMIDVLIRGTLSTKNIVDTYLIYRNDLLSKFDTYLSYAIKSKNYNYDTWLSSKYTFVGNVFDVWLFVRKWIACVTPFNSTMLTSIPDTSLNYIITTSNSNCYIYNGTHTSAGVC
jgi:hypothetical protein